MLDSINVVALTVFKTKTEIIPKTEGTESAVFWHQMNGFLRLDNRQDLKLRPNWDRRNNNDGIIFISTIYHIIGQSE